MTHHAHFSLDGALQAQDVVAEGARAELVADVIDADDESFCDCIQRMHVQLNGFLREFNRDVFGIIFGMEATAAAPVSPPRHILPEPRSKTPKAWIDRAGRAFWAAMKRLLNGI